MTDELYGCHCGGSNCFCANIKRAENKITSIYNHHLEQAGITRGQYALLVHIEENPCVSVSHLAQLVGLERTTLVRNLKPLENRGLIQDTACKGRSRSLKLTEEGKQVLSHARIFWQKAQTEMEEALGPEMIEQFHLLVERIMQI